MSRVLFMSTAEKGHLNPMIGVAVWLRQMGHQVAWLCIPAPADQLRTLGIEQITLENLPPPPVHITGGEPLARLVRDPLALRAWIKSLLLDAVPAQIEPVRAAFRAYRPDVIALDPMLYQGVIAAHREQIPYVGISSSLNPVVPPEWEEDLTRTVAALTPQRQALFADHGMAPEFRVCDCLSPYANTVFATKAYVGDVAIPAETHLVGPSRPPGDRGDEIAFPWERLGEKPVVYASFGSQISWQPALFRKIAEACAPLDVTLVLSAGELTGMDLPGSPIIVDYAPQLALLARISVLITHGGANSVMEALWAGVPMLMSPVCNDQPLGGRFLTRSGAGIVLDLHTDDPGPALRALLQDGPHRAAAHRIRDSYRAHDGARTTAEIVARVGRTPTPT